MQTFDTLDWIVIGVFCLLLIGVIVYVVRQKSNDSADYFLGGKDAGWIALPGQELQVVWPWRTGKYRVG